MKHEIFHDERPTACWSERSDRYAGEILRSGRYRIIRDRNDLQWIIQKRGAETAATPRWDNISYHRDRNALVRVWRRLDARHAARTWPELDRLPVFYRGIADG